MKKLIEKLEKEKQYQTAQKTFAGYWYAKGLDLALQIVKSHDPWIPISKLPHKDERIQLAEYGIEYSISVILTDQDKINFEVGFYNYNSKEWILPSDADFTPTHWTYLPEVKDEKNN